MKIVYNYQKNKRTNIIVRKEFIDGILKHQDFFYTGNFGNLVEIDYYDSAFSGFRATGGCL